MAVRNNHVVRVTVLGLAGITVDRMKCRDKVKLPSAPASPSHMRSLVAFSRNSIIKAMTTQSKPLTRSPSDDIVVAQQGKIQDDESATNTTGTATNTTGTADQPQRHVAVWATETGTIGSVVTFEANLQSIGNQRFAPMSFDLTIALAEDDDKDHKIALPFAVATLAITGSECKNGRSLQLDLPVVCLASASPPTGKAAGKKGGFSGYPMIAISPRPKEMPTKRTALQRFFQRHKKPKVPTEAVCQAFAGAYSVDPNGDAILRVAIEVYEKGSELEKTLLRGDSTIENSLKQKPVKGEPSERVVDQNNTEPPDRSPAVEGDSNIPIDNDTIGSRNSHDETYDSTYDGTFEGTYEGDTEDQSAGSGTYATNEDKLGFFAWNNAEGKSKDDDSYTLSFEKKVEVKAPEVEEPDGIDPMEIDFFGRKIQIPMCASLPIMREQLDENGSVISRETKGRLNQLVNDFRDDLTHVTADIFGRNYNIPVCSAIKALDEYDDDYTMFTERDTIGAGEGDTDYSWTDHVCRRPQIYSGSPLNHCGAMRKAAAADKETEGKEGMNPVSAHDKAAVSHEEATKTIPLPPASAKDWVLSSRAPVKKHHGSSRGHTDSSPRGIHDFPPATPALARQPALPKKLSPVGKSISDFFGFTHPQGEREAPAKYEISRPDVPPVICPDDGASVGDLTANTHEMNIASEMNILERYRKKFHEQEVRERDGKAGSGRVLMSVPIAFGGAGMCLGSTTIGSASSPIRVTSAASNSIVESKNRANENYFQEYDDYSIAAPGARQGRDPPPTDDDVNDLAVSFNPIEMTITGYHV